MMQTTLISDAMVFAMMARANKVLVGAHALLANGGIIGPCGINMVALAARKHSVPFVVLVGLHKLTPIFPHDQDLTLNDFKVNHKTYIASCFVYFLMMASLFPFSLRLILQTTTSWRRPFHIVNP